MARKRINKRKLLKKKPAKASKGGALVVLRLISILLQFSFFFAIIFGCYFILAFVIHLFDKEHPGTNIKSEKISISHEQVSYIVGTKNSKTIALHVYKTIVRAETLLLLDFQDYPSFEKGKKFYDLLVTVQKQKPGLSIFVVANNETRNFSDSYPVGFAMLAKAGINVIFTDPSVAQTYHWIYSPLATALSALAPSALSVQLKRWIKNTNRRNVIISQGDWGMSALTGTYSLLKNNGRLEMAVKLADSAVLPILKSELFLIREFMDNNSDNFSGNDGETVKRNIESSLKNVLNTKYSQSGKTSFEYLSEGMIKKRLNNMFLGVEQGDSVDIIAGKLSSTSIIKAIRFADLIGAKVRVLFNKNNFDVSNPPGLPNILTAHELFSSSKKLQVQWIEGHATEISFVHIYNKNKGKDQTLLLTCPMTEQYINNYNLAGACYVNGNIKDSARLITLFNTYSNSNATRQIYASRYTKYPLTQTKRYYSKLHSMTKAIMGISD